MLYQGAKPAEQTYTGDMSRVFLRNFVTTVGTEKATTEAAKWRK